MGVRIRVIFRRYIGLCKISVKSVRSESELELNRTEWNTANHDQHVALLKHGTKSATLALISNK